MKVSAEQILKPGAVLTVKKIDFADEQIKDFIQQAVREQKRIRSYMPQYWSQKQWQMLHNVITI